MRPRKQIAVLGSFLTNAQSVEYAIAEDLGYLLAKNGFSVICGGHGGIANPLVSGVSRGGGIVRGIAMAAEKFPKRTAEMNPHITEVAQVNSIAERLEALADSDGYVFFTGGIGTLSEFAFIWHSLQVAADFSRPVILISRGWNHLLADIKREQMIKQKYYRIVHLCERAKDAVAVVTNDYSIKYDDPGGIFSKEAVIFELDGTIVESPEEVFIRLCENFGYFFRMQDVIAQFRKAQRLYGPLHGKTTTEDAVLYHRHILENLGIDTRAGTELAEYISNELNQTPALYDDVMDTLHYFKENGFSTGIISSRHPLRLEEILSTHKLSGLFDFVGRLDPPAGSSDTRPFHEALVVSGFRTDEMLYIGNNFQEDCQLNRSTDIDSILLDRHLTHILNDEAFKIRSLKELRHLVKPRRTSTYPPPL
ncbi:MAG TPA: LOG family protein, partial [Geobacteraceae bacterium]|nr:LOG family protein [Geobacteraceae bacterium]